MSDGEKGAAGKRAGATRPPEPSATMLTILAGRALEARLNATLGRHGLSLRLLGALGPLAARPEISYSELARRARVTVQSMHATVAELVALGAVEPPAGGRGRTALLSLTPQGRRLFERGTATVAGSDAELEAALPAGRARLERDLLVVLAQQDGVDGPGGRAKAVPA